MADESASASVEVKDGKLISGEVTDKITAKTSTESKTAEWNSK